MAGKNEEAVFTAVVLDTQEAYDAFATKIALKATADAAAELVAEKAKTCKLEETLAALKKAGKSAVVVNDGGKGLVEHNGGSYVVMHGANIDGVVYEPDEILANKDEVVARILERDGQGILVAKD